MKYSAPIKGKYENTRDQREYERGFFDGSNGLAFDPPLPVNDKKARAAYLEGFELAQGKGEVK